LKGTRCTSTIISFPYITENSKEVIIPSFREYCWRLKYREVGEEDFQISPNYPFTYVEQIEEEIPEETTEEEVEEPSEEITEDPSEIEIVLPNEKEEEKNEEKEERVVEKVEKNIIQDIQIPKTIAKKEDPKTQNPPKEVKGEKTVKIPTQKDIIPSCDITFDKRSKKYSIKDCALEFPDISSVEKYSVDEQHDYVLVKGTLSKNLLVNITILDCEKFSLFQPSTWFKCKEIKKEEQKKINLLYSPKVKIKSKNSTISAYDVTNDEFTLRIFSEKLNDEKISLTFDIYFYINISGIWLDFRDTVSKEISYKQKLLGSGTKPFGYVFEKIIGVTQWHGKTAFNSEHTGIDFGSVKEPILAPMDGTVVAIGWDDYYGKCNSGGRYIKVKHTNGMYTVYMHLENYLNNKDETWNVGDKIQKGQQIGISGNTGAYNCQPLGYHLHYELRKGIRQSTHTDPVPYTDVNWDLIPTINWQRYPGRLSGDNPHPNF
jgi:murein DD-endopeptidase MepM/ murein hydrolase activator NlpD